MGWSSGSQILSEIIDVIQDELPDEELREAIYQKLIAIFSDHDCDTLDECVGVDPSFDSAYKEVYVDDDIVPDDDWDDQNNTEF